MHWAAPEYAWLGLLAAPALFLLHHARQRQRQGLALLYGHTHPERTGYRDSALVLPALAGMLLIAALCRPQWGQVPMPQQTRGLDLLIALDVSRSMLADDHPPGRLATAKHAIAGLLAHLLGERIGLIAFAGSAFQVCPLTGDYAAFAEVLRETDAGSIPLGGTTLASPLAEARRVFSGRDGRGKYLVLISDGEDQGNAAATATAAAALRSAGVTLYGVAVGTRSGGLIPLGGGGFLKDRQGVIVRTRADPESLAALAGSSRMYDLTTDAAALEHLYLADLPVREGAIVQTSRQQFADRFQYPLALALLLLLSDAFLRRGNLSS